MDLLLLQSQESQHLSVCYKQMPHRRLLLQSQELQHLLVGCTRMLHHAPNAFAIDSFSLS